MNNSDKKVSIIIPTGGGRPEGLRAAIYSALNQEYRNIEVIVVSDGKNDSFETVKKCEDARLKYIESEKWGDPVRIREIGIDRSEGELICFLDDDDILYPNHISTLIEHVNSKTIPFSRAMYVFKEEGKNDRKTLDIEPENPSAPYYKSEYILEQNIAPISSFLIQKSMHYAIGGFDKNLIRLEDWDYWARMSLNFELKFIDVVTNEIRVNLDKVSRTIRKDIFKDTNRLVGLRIRERLQFMKKNNKHMIDEEVKSAVSVPSVSVIMPIYNAQKFLKEAIESILNQTFKDFELLLINDGSTDASKEIVEQYRNNRRVRIFHKKNEGVTKTLNFGLSQAVGRYIARMDADDISMPERLELQVEFLDEHRNVGLLGTRFKAITEDKKFIENLDVELTNEELQGEILKSCRFGHPTVMMRRSALEAVGPYDESSWAHTVEDYDLWLRIAEKFEVANLPQYLLLYRVSPNSITQTKKEINQKGTKECIRRAKKRRGLESNTFVSICIPAYKQPELLKKAIGSILIQTHKNYEIIVTDDSPDSSVEDVCKEYIARQAPLLYIRNNERKGTPENWNESMRHARGEYIKILHHDDWFPEEGSLAEFVEMLDQNSSADFAFSGSLNFNPEGKLQFIHKAKSKQIKRLRENPEYLFSGNFIGAPSATIFRSGMNLFFDRQFKWVVDLDFYIQALKKNKRFVFTAEPFIAIRMQSPDQVTAACVNDKDVQINEYLNLYKKLSKKSNIDPYHFVQIWKLFERFNVYSQKDIRECGYTDPIPHELDVILFFKRNKVIQTPLYLWRKIVKFVSLTLKISMIGTAFCVACVRKSIDRKNKP